MSRLRVFSILLGFALCSGLVFVACGGDDDDSASTTPVATATSAGQSAKTATGTGPATTAATTNGATSTSASGSNVYDVSDGEVPFEVCDVFTAAVVADAIGQSAGDFENNSLGRQILSDPFVIGEQCEWRNYTSGNGDGASVLAGFTATADEASGALETDCQGQEMVDVGADAACYPEFTGQLRAVKGNVHMIFMLSLGDSTADFKGIEKKLAEATIANLP